MTPNEQFKWLCDHRASIHFRDFDGIYCGEIAVEIEKGTVVRGMPGISKTALEYANFDLALMEMSEWIQKVIDMAEDIKARDG